MATVFASLQLENIASPSRVSRRMQTLRVFWSERYYHYAKERQLPTCIPSIWKTRIAERSRLGQVIELDPASWNRTKQNIKNTSKQKKSEKGRVSNFSYSKG